MIAAGRNRVKIEKIVFEIGVEPLKKSVRCYIEYILYNHCNQNWIRKKESLFFWYKIMETPQLSPLLFIPRLDNSTKYKS